MNLPLLHSPAAGITRRASLACTSAHNITHSCQLLCQQLLLCSRIHQIILTKLSMPGCAPMSINVTSLTWVDMMPQVFRTEHYSHAINTSKKSGALGLIAVIVYTIAAVALLSCAIAHPGEVQNTLLHPQHTLALISSPAFPWRQIAFTGLLSTDFVIYIEVCASCCDCFVKQIMWHVWYLAFCLRHCIIYQVSIAGKTNYLAQAYFAGGSVCCETVQQEPLYPHANILIFNALQHA